MNRLEAIYNVTKEIRDMLAQHIESEDREKLIEQVSTFLDTRSEMIEDLLPPFTEQEKLLGKQVVKLNKDIEQSMKIAFDRLKADIKQVNKQKKTNRSYINPYGQIKSTDGMYLDSKQ